MPYQSLTLPSTLRADVRDFIRGQLEPQLVGVHTMLRLPIKEDAGLQGGCNLSVTQVLLSVVSGVSVTVYDPGALTRRGDRGTLFKDLLVSGHYPWSQEQHIPGARLGADAADDLYRLFRNPLVHTLGVIDSQDNPTGRRVVVEKGSFREEAVEATERATSRPTDWEHPTLREDGTDLILWVRSFYWGVRMMIQHVAGACAQRRGQISYGLPSSMTEWRAT